ncbi:hypothetical protein COV17_04245 [Candidatus Woesearchaeota archaeon CG10_big_fil_rev_8_21_14_0_10_36_11]|nr:MAG: hypothetical protein COV17_04245 [Candidatus Woesearchaeota archaeon CG10_big_fil_rev_8_21_14_0_10_36_11]
MADYNQEIRDMRKRWLAQEKFLVPTEKLSEDVDIHRLDEIMRKETGLTFQDLRKTFDFRFSGAIVRGGLNRDNYVLTLPTHQGTGKYALPGGKMDVTKIPFSAFVFAFFWRDNQRKYEENVFTNGDYNAPLARIVDGNRQDDIERYVVPLEKLAEHMDFPFERDYLSDIRREGYRELEEEMGLQKPPKSQKRDFRGKKAFITSADVIGIFLDRYRVAHPMGEEVAKRWFVSFNYLVHVNGSRRLITDTVEKGLRKSGEAEGVRWASLAEVSRPGYESMYHDTVHQVAVRMNQLELVKTEPRHGRVYRPKVRKENKFKFDGIKITNPFR